MLVLFRTEFDKSYAEKLAIPTRFSAETTACIKSGVLTKRSRDEIVNSLATLMLVHTSRPTPEDLTMVSRRLMEKYPILKDNVDGGYVSHTCLYVNSFYSFFKKPLP